MDPILDETAFEMRYADWAKRLVAILIDGIILSPLYLMLSMAEEFAPSFLSPFYSLSSFLLGWLYYALMESGENQATFGKKLMKIKVTDMQGNRISFGKASVRYFSKILSGLILGIGFIMAAFTEKKQALHDMIAETLVLNND